MGVLSVELQNEEQKTHFADLGKGKRNYTIPQKDYAFSLINTDGIRATSRMLDIPRRTIQRWCRKRKVQVSLCPDWVYAWADGRRRRREFWRRRGYRKGILPRDRFNKRMMMLVKREGALRLPIPLTKKRKLGKET